MIRTKADMEGPIVRIKIQPVERGVRIDPMRDLERPNVRNAEIDALTEARTERVSKSARRHQPSTTQPANPLAGATSKNAQPSFAATTLW